MQTNQIQPNDTALNLFGPSEDFNNTEIQSSYLLGRRLNFSELNGRDIFCNRDIYCNKEFLCKVSRFAITSVVFGTTSYFGIQELLSLGDIKKISVCVIFNGVSVASAFNLFVPPDVHENVNEFITNWTYETYLAFSQVFLNVPPLQDRPLYTLPFLWSLGSILEKDGETLLKLKPSDHSLSNVTPQEDDLLKLMGFTTRDTSRNSKIKIVAFLISAVGLTVLNFVIKDRYENFDDFGKMGLYQDLIAMFSGTVIGGDIITRLIDDRKENMETEYALQMNPIEDKPPYIRVIRIIKDISVLFTPLAIGAILGTPFTPNSFSSYVARFGVGALYGSQSFLAQREFEDLDSQDHINLIVNDNFDGLESSSLNVSTTREKIKQFSKKYFPSMGFIAILTGYMTWAAATNSSPEVGYVVLALLASTIASFVVTNHTAANCRPQRAAKDNRLSNEVFFRFVYFALGFSIAFQYLTTLINIEAKDLNHDSKSLYSLQLIAWIFWGLVVGGNLANKLHPKMNFSSHITPPIAYQELTKTLVGNLEAR